MHGFRRIAAVLPVLTLLAHGGCAGEASRRQSAPVRDTAPPDVCTAEELTGSVSAALCRTEPRIVLRLPETSAEWDISYCIGQARAGSAAASEGLRKVTWQLLGNELTVQPEYRAAPDTLRREKAELMLCAVQFAVSAKQASPPEQALLIHDRILRECSYRCGAPEGDSAAGALLLHEAECGGYAAAFALLAEAVGLPCRTVTGAADGVPHAWNLIALDGEWYHTDCAFDDTEPSQPHRFFLRSDAEMRSTHTWDAAAFPAAEGSAYSYTEIAAGMQRSRPLNTPAGTLPTATEEF